MEFKIGDRVKINEKCSQKPWRGLEGNVIENKDKYRQHLTCVRLDKATTIEFDPHLCWMFASKYSLIKKEKYFKKVNYCDL